MEVKKLRIVLFLVLGLSAFFSAQAQEKIVYDQYHWNYYLINPAIAGSTPCTHFMLTHKQQWVGLPQSPYTSTLSFRHRFQHNIGIGAYIFNDRNGYSYLTGGELTLAYHIPLIASNRYSRKQNYERQLSFGVSFKFQNYRFDDKLYQDKNAALDPVFSEKVSNFVPNANVGVYFKSYGFYTGFTMTNLVQANKDYLKKVFVGGGEPYPALTGFFLIGNAFEVDRGKDIDPSLVFKFDVDGNFKLDVNLKYEDNDEKKDFGYWVGISFRQVFDGKGYQTTSLLPNAAFRYKKFYIGYACGIDLNRLITTNYGSHEIMLGYTFCHQKKFCR
ncbi:MAG: type IX secretion system membrane protein PorP/SprF [Paludibacteraceae bacterium]|nr:type IX secretion system membrane protein PorP/SprF [Paludibacteraceae bacterium]